MFPKPMTVGEIAAHIGAKVDGDETLTINALASMEEAGPADITFAYDIKRLIKLEGNQAGAVIIPDDVEIPPEAPGATWLRVSDGVDRAIATLLGILAGPDSERQPAVGIAPSAEIDPSAELADDVAIGPKVVIGRGSQIGSGAVLCAGVKIGPNVKIGAGCLLQEGVVVRHTCVLGQAVYVGPNSVVGADGFGYFFADGVHHKVPHAGNVVIEDGVELGACVCVDRAKWGSTRIGAGTKIDNLCQIAHNVQIGPGCLLAGQVGIAGSTKLGRFVVLAGQVGVADNIEVGDGVTAGAQSGIAQSVPAGKTIFGYIAKDANAYIRELTAMGKLPDLLKQVKKLEKRVKELENVRSI